MPTKALLFAAALLSACPPPDDGVGKGTFNLMEPDAELAGRRTFFDFPWPASARVHPDGAAEVEGWPAANNERFLAFKAAAVGLSGAPVLPVGYFRFTAPLAPRDAPEAFAPDPASAVLLLEVDESTGQGRLLPTVAATPRPDSFTPENLLAVAPRPGVVLVPGKLHAFVVRRGLGDAEGNRLGIPPALATLMRGEEVSGQRGRLLLGHYRHAIAALDALRIPRSEVAAMTVFRPSDAVAETSRLSEVVRARFPRDLTLVGLEANPRLDAAPYCHLLAEIPLPQFQRGVPIFDTEGLFGPPDAEGVPPVTGAQSALVSLTVPRQPMPPGGYPLVVYFHGSGGRARELVDGADVGPDASPVEMWPGWVLGQRGFAMAGMALPVSPDRVPGASDFAYLNFGNPVAVRDTFRQGIFESRLFLDALERLAIPPALLSGCAGASLPPGATAYRFDFSRLTVQGQSMGAMYANLVSAVEPRIQALVPTGAGGHWTNFILTTPKIPTNEVFLGQLLGTSVTPLTFLHPGFQLIQWVLEPMDPLVSLPRLSRRPLPGHPARSVYQPVGDRDSYFPTAIFDEMVLGYGNPLAGDEVWPGVRDALASTGAATTALYPVRENLAAEDGRPYTGMAVQHPNDGGFDGHGIYRRVESVKWQYGCFHQTFHDDGVAVVPPPEPIGGSCPR